VNSADLNWSSARRHWPLAEFSRFEHADGMDWHVQVLGSGPDLVLVHGTGASTHSWSALAPLLAERYRVIAPDLPGHGFTDSGLERQSSLPGMATGLAALLAKLGADPALAVGHSAGAAVLARVCLDRRSRPRALISLNGALLPLRGLAGQFFTPAAKLLAMFPQVPRLFSWRAADRRMVARLVQETGSTPPPQMIDIYHQLVRSPRHVAGTLRMMANWDLGPMARQLPGLPAALFLVACENDHTVPFTEARRIHRLLPESELIKVPGLGHLGHEEDPAQFARLILDVGERVLG
jgi:magnesium chelatase accessory protein